MKKNSNKLSAESRHPMEVIVMHFFVAVYPERTKTSYKFSAYTRRFITSLDGCNLVEVDAASGKEAKKKAIHIIRTRLFSTNEEEKNSVKICRNLLE